MLAFGYAQLGEPAKDAIALAWEFILLILRICLEVSGKVFIFAAS